MPPRLAGFAWVASPLKRAQETARLLGAPDDLDVDPRLAEMHWGEWEGWTLERLRRDYGDEMVENESKGLDFRAAGGESYRDLQTRLQSFLRDRTSHPRAVVAVTHKGVIRAALSLATGWDMLSKPPHKLSWAAAHLFAVDPEGGLHIDSLNVPLTDPSAVPAR